MRQGRRGSRGALLALALAFAVGCATPRPRVDPLATVNRQAFALDGFTHRAIFGPLARGADAVNPEPLRAAFGRFFHNLSTPKLLLADLLQGKLRFAADDLSRFLVNTTLGFGGFLDPASRAGIEKHGEDMGQVLCTWRVPVGPYVYFPLLGPSSAAEAVSSTLDLGLAPIDLLFPYLSRDSARAELRRAIAEAHAASSGLDAYDYERVAYQKNRLRQAWDEPGFVAATAIELAGETASGTCGYQGAR